MQTTYDITNQPLMDLTFRRSALLAVSFIASTVVPMEDLLAMKLTVRGKRGWYQASRRV
ncbi:MAG: hypothetical protein JZU67_04180 [Burkholderiaceae bacterium]|nr:hypothetical protein [Burkholderiaceae bacterium]